MDIDLQKVATPNWYHVADIDNLTTKLSKQGCEHYADYQVTVAAPCIMRLCTHADKRLEVVINDFSTHHIWLDVSCRNTAEDLFTVSTMPAELDHTLPFPERFHNRYCPPQTSIADLFKALDILCPMQSRLAIAPEQYESRFISGCREILAFRST